MKLTLYLLTVIFVLAVASCKKTDLEPTPEKTLIEISGEGGESTVELEAGDWRIIRIVNNEGNLRIFGDVHALDGKIISRNLPLELDGFGILTSTTSRWGFRISHETPGMIQMALNENSSGNPFSFVIVLDNGRETREIVVEQPVSAGYSFEGIEYFLDEGDGDSVYVRNQLVTYRFDHLDPKDVDIFPFSGPNVVVNSHFESDDNYAFSLPKDEPVEVPVPADIIDGNIYLSEEKRIYGEISNEPYQPGIKTTISTPAGKSEFATSIEERRRTVSYRLTIKNKGTGQTKDVIGKWIEISPTGVYKVSIL